MKIHRALAACIVLTLFSTHSISRGKETYRNFTAPDGRTLEAAVQSYNERTGKIEIKRRDGKRLQVLPTVFCDADQEYIRQWIKVDQFMSTTKFKIAGRSNKDNERIYRKVGQGEKVRDKENTEVTFTLTLQNRTSSPLEDLKIEYRAFIKKKGYEKKQDISRVEGSQIQLNKISVGEEGTESIMISLTTLYTIVSNPTTDYYGNVNYSYSDKKLYEDDLKGFWVRIYGPSLDGKRAIRDWCYPSDTMKRFEWQDVTTTSERRYVR